MNIQAGSATGRVGIVVAALAVGATTARTPLAIKSERRAGRAPCARCRR